MDSKHSKQFKAIDLTEDSDGEDIDAGDSGPQPQDPVEPSVSIELDNRDAAPAPAPEVGQGNTILVQPREAPLKRKRNPVGHMQGSKSHKAYILTFFKRADDYKWAALGFDDSRRCVEFFRVQLEETKDQKKHWQGFIKFTKKVFFIKKPSLPQTHSQQVQWFT